MFGHQDDNQDQGTNGLVASAPVPPSASDTNDVANALGDEANSDSNAEYLDNLASETLGQSQPSASNPVSDDTASAADDQAADTTSSDNTSFSHRDEPANAASSDLLDIKKQALDELSPLVNHLDQTPEEKFKTTMMMIQANDNQSLIPEAYKAAKQISDEKERARALLDIVNEINYFTHKD